MTRCDSAEERLLPAGRGPHQQLERAVGHLEVVAPVLEILELLDHVGEHARRRGRQAELLGLQRDGRPAGHLADHEAGAVADRLGVDVLVGVARPGDGAGVQAGLVGERRRPDEGLVRIGGDVDQLGDVVGRPR